MLFSNHVILILSVIGLTTIMVQTKDQCLVIGHRGACGYAPENTILSFKKAIELGVDMIEIDVHLCASGQVMVVHDDKLDRTTNTIGYIKDFTFEQLNDVAIINSMEHIPTLQEVIEVIGHAAKLAIELKGPGTALPTATIIQEYLNNGWQPDDFYILSFDHPQLEQFHALLPQIKRCATVYGMPINFPQYAYKHGFEAVATSYEYATKDFVDSAHEHGLKVFIYTANDLCTIKQLLGLGVDGIFSDFPDRVQGLLK